MCGDRRLRAASSSVVFSVSEKAFATGRLPEATLAVHFGPDQITLLAQQPQQQNDLIIDRAARGCFLQPSGLVVLHRPVGNGDDHRLAQMSLDVTESVGSESERARMPQRIIFQEFVG